MSLSWEFVADCGLLGSKIATSGSGEFGIVTKNDIGELSIFFNTFGNNLIVTTGFGGPCGISSNGQYIVTSQRLANSDVLYSNDFSNNFSIIYTDDVPTISCVAIDPTGTTILRGDTGGYIYKSTDGGTTWSAGVEVDTNSGEITNISIRNNVAICVGSTGNFCAVSNDYFDTFSLLDVGIGSAALLDADISADGTTIIGITNTEAYLSKDSGTSWALVASDSWTSCSLSDSGNVILLTATDAQLYTTINKGVTWSYNGSSLDWVDGAVSANGLVLYALSTNSAYLYRAYLPPPLPQSGISLVPTYIPTQTERTDQLHQLTCPCAGGQPVPPTSYNVRNRKIRSLATGCCERYGIVDIVVTGGSNYAIGDLLALTGGVPVAKSILVKVTDIDGSGVISTVVVYSAQYYQKPEEPYTMTTVTGSGSGATVSIVWAEVCPCPWRYTRAT